MVFKNLLFLAYFAMRVFTLGAGLVSLREYVAEFIIAMDVLEKKLVIASV
jgi:hypothetical protein